MADRSASSIATPTPTADQRRIAQESFNKAREAIAGGQLEYAITILLTACRLDPGNYLYRQTLRKSQKPEIHDADHSHQHRETDEVKRLRGGQHP